MRHFGLHIIILTLLTACSNGTTSDYQNDNQKDTILNTATESKILLNSKEIIQDEIERQDKRVPDSSKIIDPTYPMDYLFKSWAHETTDEKPAFTVDKKFFRINYRETTVNVPFIIQKDSIEIFEYHDGQTSRGVIEKLTVDSLIIRWTTGDRNEYVSYKN